MQKRSFEQIIVLDKFWINQQIYFWLLNKHSIFLVKFIKRGYINFLNINRLSFLIIKNDNLKWRKQIFHSKNVNLSKMDRIIKEIISIWLIQIANQQPIPTLIYRFWFQTLTIRSIRLIRVLKILLWMIKISGIQIPCDEWKQAIKICFRKLKNHQLKQLLNEIHNFCYTNCWNFSKINCWLLIGFWCEQLIFNGGLIMKRNFYDQIHLFIQKLVD